VAASEAHHCANTNVVGNPRTNMIQLLRPILFILCFQFISSCGQRDDYSFNIKEINGLWAVTYTDNKDSYEEAFFTDSLVVLLGEDGEHRYRYLEITDNDSIKFYSNGEVYLTGKIELVTDEKLKITTSDLNVELIKIHNLLLDDQVMADMIKGYDRKWEKEELWSERFHSRMIEWKEERGLIKK
jgi:hypothetical protein